MVRNGANRAVAADAGVMVLVNPFLMLLAVVMRLMVTSE